MEFRYLVEESRAQSSWLLKALAPLGLAQPISKKLAKPHLSVHLSQFDLDMLAPARHSSIKTSLGSEPSLARTYLCAWQTVSPLQLLRLTRISDVSLPYLGTYWHQLQRERFEEHGIVCTLGIGTIDLVIGESVYAALRQPFGGKFMDSHPSLTFRLESSPYASETSEWRAARKQA